MTLWQSTLKLKLKVNVVLLGLDNPIDDGSLVVHEKVLARTLKEVLSSYHPVVHAGSRGGEAEGTGEASHHHRMQSPALEVRYDISYSVKHASQESHSAYLEALANAAEVDSTGEDGSYRPLLVPIEAISQAVEGLAAKESGMSPSPEGFAFDHTEVTILVANPSRAELRSRLESRGIQNPSTLQSDIDAGRVVVGEFSFAESSILRTVSQGTGTKNGPSSAGGVKERRRICARSWVGQGRVLVLDLAAVACRYGAVRGTDPHSTVAEDLFPSVSAQESSAYWLHGSERVHQGNAGSGHTPGSIGHSGSGSRSARDPATVFNLKLCSLVVSAIRTTLAPAVPSDPGPGDASEVVLVPLLVFRGGGGSGAADAGEFEELNTPLILNDVIDIAQVSTAVNAMALPQQEIVVVGAVHSFSEHPQVAVALAKSLATNARMHRRAGSKSSHPNFEFLQEGFVDSNKLLLEMKSTGDALASSLLSDAGGRDWDHLLRLDVALAADDRPQGLGQLHGAAVRVLPVFVFCLGNTEEPLVASAGGSTGTGSFSDGDGKNPSPRKERPAQLFEGSRPFAAEVGGNAVLVLQSEGTAPVPFFEHSDIVRLPMSDATQAVVSGLLRGMHGTAAPDHWWSSQQQDATLDLSWAHGYHPFAPFGFGGAGALLAEVARRNAVVSRAAAAAGALVEAARTLEDFVNLFVPSEPLMEGSLGTLIRNGGETNGAWGKHFHSVAESSGLPAHIVKPVVGAHQSVLEALDAFEQELQKVPVASFAEALAAMEMERQGAEVILGQATLATSTGEKELEWCQCSTLPVSGTSHVPWIVYLGVLVATFYGFWRVIATAHRALFKYGGSSRSGLVGRW